MNNYYKWHGCQILTPCEVTQRYKSNALRPLVKSNSARIGSGSNSLFCTLCLRNARITADFGVRVQPRAHPHPCTRRTVSTTRAGADPVRAVFPREAERMSGRSIWLQGADERAWMRLLHDLRSARGLPVRGLYSALRHRTTLHAESRRPTPASLAHSRTGCVHRGPRRARCVSSLFRRIPVCRSDAKP